MYEASKARAELPLVSAQALALASSSERTILYQDRNLRYVRATGSGALSAQRVVGSSESDLFPAADAHVLTEVKRRVLQSRNGTVIELRAVFNGSKHLLELTIEPWLDLECKLLGVITYVRDISGDRALKEALLEQFRRTSAIFGALNAVVYVADMQTNELLFLNTYAQKLFGHDAVGKPCFSVLQSGQTGRCEFCTNHLLVRDGQPQPAHTWEFRNTVTGRWFLCIDQAIPWTDGTLKRMEVAVDITDRKQAEQFRQQYVGIVSHDLGNPLGAVVLGCELLERAQSKGDKDRSLDIIRRMKRNLDRMKVMIRDLADSVRLESESFTLEYEMLDLPALVRDLIDVSSMSAGERGRITLVVADPIPELPGDRARIERIIQNLIGNALKYSPADTLVSVSVTLHGDYAVVAVDDRGAGIDAADLPHIFDRFYRCTRTKEVEGLGLGLYISRLLVEAHGGTLRVDSKRDKGSRFSFTLPLVRAL
jgi:hypothetical protein